MIPNDTEELGPWQKKDYNILQGLIDAGLRPAYQDLDGDSTDYYSFPTWGPRETWDQIWISKGVEVLGMEVPHNYMRRGLLSRISNTEFVRRLARINPRVQKVVDTYKDKVKEERV
jgi:hypothetical protein